MKIKFFKTESDLRTWLERNHSSAGELWIGFYKKHTGKSTITYPEALDQALCFGWIDGVRKRIDDLRYLIRFTPRQSRSVWSSVNIRRAKQLVRLGLMHPRGQAIFEARDRALARRLFLEQKIVALDSCYEEQMRAHPAAWKYFQEQPPWYRRMASRWVMRAKREETRQRRLANLIARAARGERPEPFGKSNPAQKLERE